MPTPVQLKRNGTPGASAPSSLLHGELALNYADKVLYFKDASNVIQSFTFQSYALATHTHAASDITSGTLDSARLDATLAALAGVTTSADQVIYATGSDTFATTALSAFGRSLIDDADAAAARTTLSVQPTASPAFTGTATFQAVTIVDAVAGGQLLVNDNSSDSTNRFGTLGTSHYTLSEEPVQATGVTATSTENVVYIGGGYSQFNAATSIIFHTAANNTTTTGTARLTISSTGTATFAGQIVGQAGAVLTGTVAGNVRQLRMQTSGSTRWEVGPGFDAESGSNVGSTFWITRWSDSGVFLGTPISIARATGVVTLENQLLVSAGSGSSGSYKPGVAISGDDDTGIHQVSGNANTLSIVTNGTERVRVGSGGRTAFYAASEKFGVQLNNGATANGPFIGSDGADIFTICASSGAERVRVDASGRVGIGVAPGSTSPYALTVYRGSVDSVIMAQGLLTDSPFNGTGKSAVQLDVDGKGGFAWQNDASSGTRTLKLLSNSGYGAGDSTLMTVSSGGTITASQVYSDTVGATNRDLFVDSTGKLGYVSSIRESKTDIVTLDDVSWLSALSPVSYRYRKRNADGTYSDEADGVTDYGLIAEDVEAVRPELCFYDDVDGEPQLRGVTYSKLITPMLRYIQQLEARIAALEERLSHA